MLSGSADRIFSYAGPLIALDSGSVDGIRRPDIFLICRLFHMRYRARVVPWFSSKKIISFSVRGHWFSISGRRWHISLSTFCAITFITTRRQSGPSRPRWDKFGHRHVSRRLWHGALDFCSMGFAHGSYLVVNAIARGLFEHKEWANTLATRLLAWFATYAAVCIAWVFFRASDFTIAARMLGGILWTSARDDAILTTREMLQIALVTGGMILVHWSCAISTSKLP